MNTRQSRHIFLLILLCSVCMFSICGDPDYLVFFYNEDFESWCDNRPCSWDLEIGAGVERAPTWHERDFAAKLFGSGAILSQAAQTDATCLKFDIIAHVPESTQLFIEFDVADDDREAPEMTVRLPNNSWKPFTTAVPIPDWAGGRVRVILRQEGVGESILARVHAYTDRTCSPVIPANWKRPWGADCSEPESCTSGKCEPIDDYPFPSQTPELQSYCVECAMDEDCVGEEICGLDATSNHDIYRGCGPAGRHFLGERCLTAMECLSSICCDGVCSSCCNGNDMNCPEGQSCVQANVTWPQTLLKMPFQCAPQQNIGEPQFPCISDDDCRSAKCSGTGVVKLCESNGAPCADTDSCNPQSLEDCVYLGIKNGYCQ